MPQFTEANVTTATTITAAKYNADLAALKVAFNSLDTTNHPADSVPVTALANDKADFIIPLVQRTAIGASVAYTDTQIETYGYLPKAMTLVAVTVICGSITVAAGNTSVKLYYTGAAASNAMVLSASGAGAIDSSPPVTAFAAQQLIELRFENGAGDECADIRAFLHCKNTLVS